jgi:hypothetical protein
MAMALLSVIWVTSAHALSNQAAISSQNVSLRYPQSFSPSFAGGSGSGAWQFCVGGYTNFNGTAGQPGGTELSSGQWVSSWTPPGTGTYSFWIAHNADSNYNTAIAGPYTLTVTQGTQNVSSQNASISEGQYGGTSFTPSYSGGQGTGGYQFCIAGQTNWSPGVGQPTGTDNPSGGWQSSWMPVGPPYSAQYSFYVANNGDSNYQTSNYAGPYTLTVSGPTNGLLWDGVYNVPNPASPGQSISFFISYYNSGGTTYDNTFYVRCYPQAGGGSSTVGLSSCSPGSYGSAWFTMTVPSNPGTYTYVLQAGETPAGDFGPADYFTINVQQSTSVSYPSPSAITYPTPLSATQLDATSSVSGTITYYLDGSQTSAGTVPTVGSHTLTAILTPSDSTDYSSSSASVTLQVNQASQPAVSISPSGTTSVTAGQSLTFSASGGAGTGAYTWGGSAGASGTGTSKTVSFPSATGSPFTVTVYRAGDQNYAASGTVTVQVTVVALSAQATVTISPSSSSINAGESVSFSASGGSGTGGYTWGGQGAGTGSSDSVSFPTAGTYTVTVYRAGDTNYLPSNTATAAITVNAVGGTGDPEINVLVPTP